MDQIFLNLVKSLWKTSFPKKFWTSDFGSFFQGEKNFFSKEIGVEKI